VKFTVANVTAPDGGARFHQRRCRQDDHRVLLAAGLARSGRTVLNGADPKTSALRWLEQAPDRVFPVTAAGA